MAEAKSILQCSEYINSKNNRLLLQLISPESIPNHFQINYPFKSFEASTASVDIHVSVTTDGGDFQKGGGTGWYLLKANGEKDTWGSRATNQIVRFVRSKNPGATVESVFGVPGQTVNIY
ncbi:hypothetical protein CJF30_00000781 [Rutstroemia sp. NJR-2017a BBW]|nr:hypothetical protein CJF30_00000781 [Rutstroemia sp. NJR-2017a BBW]